MHYSFPPPIILLPKPGCMALSEIIYTRPLYFLNEKFDIDYFPDHRYVNA